MKTIRILTSAVALAWMGTTSCASIPEIPGTRPDALVTVKSSSGADECSYRLEATRDEHSRAAVKAIGKGNWPSAMQELQLAIEADPSEPKHYFFLGLVQELQGDLASAQENYDLAVEYGSLAPVEYTASQARAQEKRGATH